MSSPFQKAGFLEWYFEKKNLGHFISQDKLKLQRLNSCNFWKNIKSLEYAVYFSFGHFFMAS